MQIHCIDLHSFKLLTHPSKWADYQHFLEPINQLIGQATLETLGYLPPDYPCLDCWYECHCFVATNNGQRILQLTGVP